MASTTGRSLSARAEKTSSPLCRQFPESIPARSLTWTSATATESTRSPASLRALANPALIRGQAPLTDLDRAPISAMASAGEAASSRSTKTVSKRPSSSRRRSSSRTRLVFPIRRWAVSRVCVPARTRSARASSSTSRSKNRSPATQLAPAFLSTAILLPNEFVGNQRVGNEFVGNGGECQGVSRPAPWTRSTCPESAARRRHESDLRSWGCLAGYLRSTGQRSPGLGPLAGTASAAGLQSRRDRGPDPGGTSPAAGVAVGGGPGVNGLDAGVAEFARVPRQAPPRR